MSIRMDLGGEVLVDNRSGRGSVPASRRPGRRDGGLVIHQFGDRFQITAVGEIFSAMPLQAMIKLDRFELFNWVQDLRSSWRKFVVDHVVPLPDPSDGSWMNGRAYEEGWNNSQMSSQEFRAIGARLAVAGRDLFRFLFLSDRKDLQRTRIGEVLSEATRERELSLRMTSDAFFVPWPMIYTHVAKGRLKNDGSNFDWRGFWGYRHVVEHEIEYQESDVAIVPGLGRKIPISFNVDSRIDDTLKVTCARDQYEFFKGLACLDCTRRLTKYELEQAIRSGNFSDLIIYFFCHGKGSGEPDQPNLDNAGVALTDGEPVRAIDLEKWLFRRPLSTEPVVFINACQGGQLSTIFYATLATRFLEKKVKALIGSQIDIPVHFADEYARRFFKAFLQPPGLGEVRIGTTVRHLAREFIDLYKNPLGLVYSLYRGGDCFVDWQGEAPGSTVVRG
jgi:CHAT domain